MAFQLAIALPHWGVIKVVRSPNLPGDSLIKIDCFKYGHLESFFSPERFGQLMERFAIGFEQIQTNVQMYNAQD